MKRPWITALVAGTGTTLLVPSAFALFAPPDLLDKAVAQGDAKLWLAVCGLLGLSTLLARVALIRRRTPEEKLFEPPPVEGVGHLR